MKELLETILQTSQKQADVVSEMQHNFDYAIGIIADLMSRVRTLEMRNGIEHATEQKDIIRDRSYQQDKANANVYYINEIRGIV